MANVYKGVGVHWGVSSSTLSAAAVGTVITQGRDHTKRADKDEVRNSLGNVVQVTYFNPTDETTFEFVVSGTSGGAVQPTLPDIGNMLAITDTVYTQLAGTNWLVDDVTTTGSNTSAMRVTLRLTRYPEITS